MRRTSILVMTALALLAVASCSGDDDDDSGAPADSSTTTSTAPSDTPDENAITVTSTAFEDGQPIPSQYTCDGENAVPPLAWTGVPDDAAALAIVVDDPDAPSGNFVHWVAFDVPTETTSLTSDDVGINAPNGAGQNAYTGPCPPSGTHHYRFSVYALDDELCPDPGDCPIAGNLDDAADAIDTHVVTLGTLVGTYERS